MFVNKVLEIMFNKLTKFEAYESFTAEKASLVIKIFVTSLLNTGFIILILNYRWTQQPVKMG
jgi:hypothetical protein